MTDSKVIEVVIAIWGFLIGFVGWGSCFRLIEPITNWLIPLRPKASLAVGVSRMLVFVFFISSCLVALSLVPLLMARTDSDIASNLWRDRFGISFVSSMVGLVFLGFLRRFWGTERF